MRKPSVTFILVSLMWFLMTLTIFRTCSSITYTVISIVSWIVYIISRKLFKKIDSDANKEIMFNMAEHQATSSENKQCNYSVIISSKYKRYIMTSHTSDKVGYRLIDVLNDVLTKNKLDTFACELYIMGVNSNNEIIRSISLDTKCKKMILDAGIAYINYYKDNTKVREHSLDYLDDIIDEL